MTSDVHFRDYLLGKLPEDEAERLEEQIVADEEVYLSLRSIEDDLIDDFARGDLDGADREAFLRRHPAADTRVTFARALARRGAGTVVPFPRRPWIGLAAAATLVAAIGGTLLTRPVAPPTIPEAHPAAASRGDVPPVAAPVVLTVSLGTSRGTRGPQAVTLSETASTLVIRVRLDPADRFDRYSAELRSPAGTAAWRGDELHAAAAGGDLVLTLSVPAGTLTAGAYELAVRGGGDDLGFVEIEVRRSR